MENTKLAEDLFHAIEKNDYEKAESLLSKDFKLTGVSPEPLGAKEFLGLHKAFGKGMPDFKFNFKVIKDKNNVVSAKVMLTGTHTKELPSPMPGVNNIPPTNKSIKMPEEPLDITVKDRKISTIHVEPKPGGGVAGVLKQIGVELPMHEPSHH